MFDTKCYELAAYFLCDEEDVQPEEVDAMAQDIQDTVEAWLNGRESAQRLPPR